MPKHRLPTSTESRTSRSRPTSAAQPGRWATLAAAALIITACGAGAPPEPDAEPPAVGVVEVTLQEINPSMEFVGKIRAQNTVELRARVEGFLVEQGFAEGGAVDKDQVLFRIEPEQYEAALAQARASLAAEQAALTRASLERSRLETLREQQSVSQQQLDNVVAQELAAEAAVQSAEAGVQKAELDLSYTEIRTPIAGVIDRAAFDVGNLVGPSSGVLATVHSLDPISATFSVSEALYLEVASRAQQNNRTIRAPSDERAMQPRIRFPDGTLYPELGQFDFFDNKVDEATGTILVRAVFANPDQLLLPGQFVNMVIEQKEAKQALLIPQAAVLTDQAGRYVLVVDAENKVEVRRITTGQRFNADWQVTEGLAEGDRIILHGIQKVRPGVTVTPEQTQATPAPTEG